MFKIYIWYNRITEKVYVGKTSTTVKHRWRVHLSAANLGSQAYFHRAIRRYGWDAFEKWVLAEAETEEQANQLERLWILALRSHDRKIGYNSTFGGDGLSNPTQEVRDRLSFINKQKTISPETRKKMAQSLSKTYQGDNNPAFRKDITPKLIRELQALGWSQRRMSIHLNCARETLRSRLKEWKLCTR